MSQVHPHPQARTTPRTRAEIKAACANLAALAERYNVSKATARKWKHRDDVQDLSHPPHKLSTPKFDTKIYFALVVTISVQ